MRQISSFKGVVELWPSKEAMASDIPGATASQVSKWWQRDSIPADWWSAVLSTERASAAGVTAELLTDIAARESAEARS